MIERGAEPDVLAPVPIQPAGARRKLRHEKSTRLVAFRSRRLGAGSCIPANSGACKLVFFVPQSVIKCAHFGRLVHIVNHVSKALDEAVRLGWDAPIGSEYFHLASLTPHVLIARWALCSRSAGIAGRSMTGLSSRLGRRGSEGLARSLRDAVMANAHLRHRSANRSGLSGSHQANVGERVRGAGCVRISPTD